MEVPAPEVVYGFSAPAPRFVVLWAVDGGGLVAARDAYLAHHATKEPWLMCQRRYYFTPVVGGEDFYSHQPKEASAVPLVRLIADVCPARSYYWCSWVPVLSWWPVHGREFLETRPEVGWVAGEAA